MHSIHVHVYGACIYRGIAKPMYYFELHPQLKFKAEVMYSSSKKGPTLVLVLKHLSLSLETLLGLQGNPQKCRCGEIDLGLQD